MCACSRIFEQSRTEIYLWKDRIILSILDEISIVFEKDSDEKEWELKIEIFSDWNSKENFSKNFYDRVE